MTFPSSCGVRTAAAPGVERGGTWRRGAPADGAGGDRWDIMGDTDVETINAPAEERKNSESEGVGDGITSTPYYVPHHSSNSEAESSRLISDACRLLEAQSITAGPQPISYIALSTRLRATPTSGSRLYLTAGGVPRPFLSCWILIASLYSPHHLGSKSMSSDPEAPVPTAPAPAPVRCRGLEIQIHDVDRDQSLRALELPHPFPYAAIDPRFCLIFTPEHAAAAEKIKEERERTGEFNLPPIAPPQPVPCIGIGLRRRSVYGGARKGSAEIGADRTAADGTSPVDPQRRGVLQSWRGTLLRKIRAWGRLQESALRLRLRDAGHGARICNTAGETGSPSTMTPSSRCRSTGSSGSSCLRRYQWDHADLVDDTITRAFDPRVPVILAGGSADLPTLRHREGQCVPASGVRRCGQEPHPEGGHRVWSHRVCEALDLGWVPEGS
ncbi:hypothetical protein DFH09DRAFT_1289717 [Mycena vulgaris]|nr:hypothetical protein DFH09DRAFT_1289717 [Mycena vulgaris]